MGRRHLLVMAACFLVVLLCAGPLNPFAQVNHSLRPLDSAIVRGQKITLPAPPSHQITTPFRAGDIAWVAQPAGELEGMHPPANRVKAEISGGAVCSAAIVMAVLFVMGGVWRQRQAAPEPLLGVATVPMPSHVRLRMRRVHDPPDYIAFRGK
eukprot:EG_transcript_39923